MLLYVTTGDTGEPRESKPLHSIPDSLPERYLLGMLEHVRPGVLQTYEQGEWQTTPDWRFDRRVIRLAIYCKGPLGVKAGERVAIVGRFVADWLAMDFAVLGIGGVAVGLPAQLSDENLAAGVRESGARLAFATDEESARRILDMRLDTPNLETLIAPLERAEAEPWLLNLERVMDHAGTLDTPEHAREFRFGARGLGLDGDAFWHVPVAGSGENGLVRLDRRQLMAAVRQLLLEQPAREGDVALFPPGPVTAAARLAAYAYVGNGYTTTALATEPGWEAVPALAPSHIQATPPTVEELERALATEKPGALARSWLARESPPWLARFAPSIGRLREATHRLLGERVRRINTPGEIPADLALRLRAAQVAIRQSPDPRSAPPTPSPRPSPPVGETESVG